MHRWRVRACFTAFLRCTFFATFGFFGFFGLLFAFPTTFAAFLL
jgi:hypothetical protein